MKVILLVLLLVGCTQKGVETRLTDNPNFKVVTLFKHDGVKVYRFYDGNYRYFTSCGETTWTESCGEDCETDVHIPGRR